jgi:hypothetical protein
MHIKHKTQKNHTKVTSDATLKLSITFQPSPSSTPNDYCEEPLQPLQHFRRVKK